MWKHVLPLMLLSCAPITQSQSPSKPPSQPDAREVAQLQMQKRDIPREAEARPAVIPATWVDPHEQLARTQVTNAFIARQIALRRDTDKLLSLASELKFNVDKTNPSILSLDVIKKAQEIEKLAKSVKDKMKDAY